jgi:integrase
MQIVNALKGQGIDFPRYKSLGRREIDPITGKSNRPWAEAIAARIQADIDHPDELFDYTLAKYLSIKVADDNGNPTLLTPSATMTIGKLWDAYLDYHTADKAESTTYKYKIDCARKITQYRDLAINLDTANLIRSDFLKRQNGITKTILSLLENAVDWAINQDKLTLLKNPFKGLSKQIKTTKRKNKLTGLPDDFVAYTTDEVKTILDAFLNDDSRSKYYPFFRFKFMTGCRTGEAIALTWDNVKFDNGVILFDKTCSIKTGVTAGTKTQDCRTFPMNDNLSSWLRTLKESSSSPLVFSGNGGGMLARQTVDGVWGSNPKSTREGRPGTVIALAAQGKIAQYLSMYNTRHTFINACIERGVDTVTIADWCGNSDHIIEKVYRSRNRNIDINKQMPNY